MCPLLPGTRAGFAWDAAPETPLPPSHALATLAGVPPSTILCHIQQLESSDPLLVLLSVSRHPQELPGDGLCPRCSSRWLGTEACLCL